LAKIYRFLGQRDVLESSNDDFALFLGQTNL
jgi:hypothetical protein